MYACLIQVACLQEVATKTGFIVFAEKFTPQADPTLEELCPLGKQRGSYKGCSPLYKCWKNKEVYQYAFSFKLMENNSLL